MQNYRFTGPPPAGSIAPVDPVVSELRQIQGTLLSIMRKADFVEDWETALVAANQAAAMSQLIGGINQRVESASAATTPLYAIALRDHTIEIATAYWVDGPMFHYITRQGAHIQVRLDIVDGDLTSRLNQR